ncbi:MAG: NAD-dependent epimerase/dehydratase family protein [Chloroflexi bacterium]|nr:NAD-dependent epimerase/dehydratase family protein [Chloroflexota bacterium]
MGRNLITGGLGLIGISLARRLLRDGEEVVLFDVASDSEFLKDIAHRVKVVQGDLANWAQVADAVKSNDVACIYHLGALLTPACEASPQAAYMVNMNGTLHVLEAARLFGLASVIFTSSIATYGPGAPPVVNEDSVQRPTTMYGVTKIAAERLGDYYHRRFGVNFRCVRYPLVVGPGHTVGISRYAREMIQKPALGRPYQAYVDESVRLPLIYLRDAVWALVCLKRAEEQDLKRRVYNLGGFYVTAGELADIVRGYLPEAQIDFSPDKTALKVLSDMFRDMDGTRAREDWGFHLQYTVDEFVQDFISEVQSSPSLYE